MACIATRCLQHPSHKKARLCFSNGISEAEGIPLKFIRLYSRFVLSTNFED